MQLGITANNVTWSITRSPVLYWAQYGYRCPFNERPCALFSTSLSSTWAFIPQLLLKTYLPKFYYKLLAAWLSNNYWVIIFYLWVEHFNFFVFRVNVFFEGASNTIFQSQNLKEICMLLLLNVIRFLKNIQKNNSCIGI